MKHYPVSSVEVAQSVSEAIWQVALTPEIAATAQTQEAVGYHETVGGWVLDYPTDFYLLIANVSAATGIMSLIAPATTQQELSLLAGRLQVFEGQLVPLINLFPQSIVDELIDSEDLEQAGYGPLEIIEEEEPS